MRKSLILNEVLRAPKYIFLVTSSPDPARPFKRTIAAALSRASALTLGPLTSNYPTQPSTGDVIRKYCEANKDGLQSVTISTHTSSTIENSEIRVGHATLHFLTDFQPPQPPSNRVMLYFHGGGYYASLFGASHICFALHLAFTAHASLTILEYSLAPQAQYPGQLVQAIAALDFLLRPTSSGGRGVPAKDVVLMGGSAGANLVVGVLAHLKKPCPYAELVTLEDRLGGAVLISPWVGMKFERGSYEVNKRRETIHKPGVVGARERWGQKDEIWADMLGSDSGKLDRRDFWRRVSSGEGRAVERTLVTVGGDEIMLDDAVAFAGMAGVEVDEAAVELVRSEGETHCGAMLDAIIGLQQHGSMLMGVLEWLEKM